MTDSEIRDWLALLGRTPEAQRKVLSDLMLHAIGDEMSASDLSICRRAFDLIQPVRGPRYTARGKLTGKMEGLSPAC